MRRITSRIPGSARRASSDSSSSTLVGTRAATCGVTQQMPLGFPRPLRSRPAPSRRGTRSRSGAIRREHPRRLAARELVGHGTASSGSTLPAVRRFVRAPAQRAARSAALTDRPCLTMRRASFRRSSWSGTASTARACPSESSPRSTRPRTSSGRSSSRIRLDTDGFERPTRSATSPSESANSSWRVAYARASSIGERSSRATFSTSARRRESRSSVGAHQRRDGCEAGRLGGAPAAFAGDQLVGSVRDRPDDDRLDDALNPDRLRKAGERLRIEAPPRLEPIRPDRSHGQLRQLGVMGRSPEQDLEPPAEPPASFRGASRARQARSPPCSTHRRRVTKARRS